jgi:hypothetical protein
MGPAAVDLGQKGRQRRHRGDNRLLAGSGSGDDQILVSFESRA